MKAFRRKIKNNALFIIFILILVPLLYLALTTANTHSNNYENVTVPTRVNITNSKPDILAVVIEGGASSLTLTAGTTRTVICNVSVRDYNGIDGNISVNATFFRGTAGPLAIDGNNTHYTNSSCNISKVYGQNNIYGNYTCAFNVWYFANNGSWNCTAFVLDVKNSKNYTANRSNSIIINPLYALNVSDGIDYGEMAVGEISGNRTANVTVFGNMNINLTLRGYAVNPDGKGPGLGDGLAMICQVDNISIDNEKFSANSDADFSTKMALNGSTQDLANFTMLQPTDATVPIINTTYWQLSIPIATNPFGNCSGFILFAAKAG